MVSRRRTKGNRADEVLVGPKEFLFPMTILIACFASETPSQKTEKLVTIDVIASGKYKADWVIGSILVVVLVDLVHDIGQFILFIFAVSEVSDNKEGQPVRCLGIGSDTTAANAFMALQENLIAIFLIRFQTGYFDPVPFLFSERESLAVQIKEQAWCWALGRAEVAEIDRLNILRASHLAMQRAVGNLDLLPGLLLVDGNLLPKFSIAAVAVVRGDARVPQISAASIIAKVARDAEMVRLARIYPGYGLEKHKGYGTLAHFAALERLGPCPLHRRSFAPIRQRTSEARVPQGARV